MRKPAKKKSTRKAVPKRPVQVITAQRTPQPHQCTCVYDRTITSMMQEAWDDHLDNIQHFTTFSEALSHSEPFNNMLGAAGDPETNHYQLLVDVARIGYEAGRRASGIQQLERMVNL